MILHLTWLELRGVSPSSTKKPPERERWHWLCSRRHGKRFRKTICVGRLYRLLTFTSRRRKPGRGSRRRHRTIRGPFSMNCSTRRVFLDALATTVLVEALLQRNEDGDVERCTGGARPAGEPVPTDPGLVPNEITLLRLRALLARAHGDEAGYRDYRDRYRAMATSLGFEGHIAVGRGDAMTAAAPSGVVTFLFTDVEGSTRRWEADADGMRIALAAHDEVLRGAIEAHGGWLFKHTGDGVCAAFESPRCAVDAAVAAQLCRRDRGVIGVGSAQWVSPGAPMPNLPQRQRAAEGQRPIWPRGQATPKSCAPSAKTTPTSTSAIR